MEKERKQRLADELDLLIMSQNKRYCKKSRELFKRVAKAVQTTKFVPTCAVEDRDVLPTKLTINAGHKYIDIDDIKI